MNNLGPTVRTARRAVYYGRRNSPSGPMKLVSHKNVLTVSRSCFLRVTSKVRVSSVSVYRVSEDKATEQWGSLSLCVLVDVAMWLLKV